MTNPQNIQTAETFWARIDRAAAGCWPWVGKRLEGEGYGLVRWKGREEYAHRKAWETTYGPIPVGLMVLHRCDNPPCVRPDHLFLGTDADNKADMVAKGRQAKHKLTAEAVLVMRSMAADGWSTAELSRRFDVSTVTVRLIVARKAWKWLAPPASPSL